MSKYRFYSNGKNKVVAVSTYAGKTVKGVAKCDPRDSFYTSKGEELAMVRCAEKIAAKRVARSKKEFEKAKNMVAIAQRKLEKMDSYVKDSVIAYNTAKKNRENLESSF